MNTLVFRRDDADSRFTLHRDDTLVSILDFRDDGSIMTMTRAYTVPSERGHGYAAEVVDRAVASLEAEGSRRVLPMCWYVAEWFDANPERRAILAP